MHVRSSSALFLILNEKNQEIRERGWKSRKESERCIAYFGVLEAAVLHLQEELPTLLPFHQV